jgi:hypothetical protein
MKIFKTLFYKNMFVWTFYFLLTACDILQPNTPGALQWSTPLTDAGYIISGYMPDQVFFLVEIG